MIAELGLFSLLLALLFALLQVVIPSIGLVKKNQQWIATASFYAVSQFGFIAIAYLCLSYCFLQDDFTVSYVLSNSSLSLPWFYKLCAVWGGHEGSMLLWIAILSAWTLAVCLFSRNIDAQFRCRVLIVLGVLSAGLLLFLLMTSNPFLRQFQDLNSEGRDLNPLLQDPGFLFHPPMLYMGYVGFSVAFAFAISALWMGKLESVWAKWTRPWTLAAWCCLTLGITLGSWWAYRELGWGGWWFWDPVENASFMPWLVGTALLHSLAVSEQRQQFVAWTLLLAISAFALSLIGTFLVRSGVLTSVHAFAVDPQRGVFILCFLLFVIGGSLLLFALRAHTVQAKTSPTLFCKESALLLNNVFLTVAMLTVLMGTVYPLLIDGLGLGKLSVGVPYFNTVFIPLMLPLLVLMGLGIHLHWGRDVLQRLAKRLLPVLLLALVSAVIFLYAYFGSIHLLCLLAVFLSFWVIMSSILLFAIRARQRGFLKMGRAFYGMLLAHIGLACCVLGISISSTYGVQDDVRMEPGSRVSIAGYTIGFEQERTINGANYHGAEATFIVYKGKQQKRIYPQKRIYNVGKMAMTESAIDVNPFRDIYVALGEPLDQSAWSVRVYYKPFIRWIWAGGFLIFLGGLCAMLDKRYAASKQTHRQEQEVAA